MADTNLNVSFLRGTQAKLNSLTTYQPGAFYLTEDTDRLYFAQAADKLAYLNKYITTVNAVSDLPTLNNVNVGDFYYVSASNILCTKANDSAVSWTQINSPDTNDDTSLTGVTFTSAVENDNIVVSYSLIQTKKDIKGDTTDIDPITGTFTIKGSDIGTVVTDISLDVKATVENNVATIELDGSGKASDADGFTIEGGKNITIDSSNNGIVVTANNSTYTLSSPENTTNLVLKDDKGDSNTINIIAGDSNPSIEINGIEANKIAINHKNYNYNNTALNDQTPSNGGTFNIVSGINLENGHVTGVSTNSVTLPDMTYKITSVDADSNGKIYVTLVDFKGDVVAGSVTSSEQKLYYLVNGTQIYNQAELTNYFYTKDYIDTTLKDANAMTFKGDVGDLSETNTTLPTTNVKAGDTYIVVGNTIVTGSGNFGYKGDLFIASGEENENGYLNSINWIHIPAGDEIDTTYSFSFDAGKGLVIKNNASGDETVLVCAGDDNAIDVTTDGQLKVIHKNIIRNDPTLITDTLGGGSKFTVVTGVTSNDQGHITAVATKEFTMPSEDVYRLERADVNTVNLKDKNGDIDGTIKIFAGERLVVNSTDNNIGSDFTISHNTITVDSASATAINLNAANSSTNKNFTVITGIEDDGYGHISKITTTQYNMPYDSTYTLEGTVADNTITTILKDRVGDNVGSSQFTLASDTLAISTNGTTISANLQWGSF